MRLRVASVLVAKVLDGFQCHADVGLCQNRRPVQIPKKRGDETGMARVPLQDYWSGHFEKLPCIQGRV